MFSISILLALFYLILSIGISINWIIDIAKEFGYFIAIYIVTFVALIPGFNYMFMLVSMIFKEKKIKVVTKYPNVTILIPVYNSEKSLKNTLESIRKQKYNGKIFVYVLDDGSTDSSLLSIRNVRISNMKVLRFHHAGKAETLNKGLEYVKTDYFITIDSDTILHNLAVKNIINKLINSEKEIASTAGCLFLENENKNFITKIQEWDYSLGIFGVKCFQVIFSSTLVTQGAFSAYKLEAVKKIGGWKKCVGEDIVLTWELLCYGYRTNFAEDAIAFTEVPVTLKALLKQRKRWARGMVEAFKIVPIYTSPKLNIQSKILMSLDIFFPFIDIGFMIFIPLGLILLLFGNFLLIGWMYLIVIPFGLLFCFIVNIKMLQTLKSVDYKLYKRSFFAFLVYILLYAFILAPACLSGYIAELLNIKKEW